MSTIIRILKRVDELDAEDVIFAKPEWGENAEARIFPLTNDHRAPIEAGAAGFKYFLEVDVVRQVLEEFRGKPNASLTTKCRRVIHYATFDA
jgi:hypothetical protein